MPVTLRQWREEAVRNYKRNYYAEGTTATTGTPTVLPDTNRQEPAGEWARVDAFLHFIGGSFDGLTRRVTGYSAGAAVIFAPALSGNVPSGQQYAVYKHWDPIADMVPMFNEARRDIAGERRIYGFATAAEVSDNYIVNVPSVAANRQARILKIDRSMWTTNSAHEFEELYEGRDYDILRLGSGYQQIRLRRTPVTGQLLRFHYESDGEDLVNDTDTIDEPLNLLLYAARKHMALAEGDNAGLEKWNALYEKERDKWLDDLEGERTKRPRIRVY